jgi:DNA-binding LytR/AlgR family response regulator
MQAELLQIPQAEGIYLLEPGSILRVEASNNYCKIHFINQQRRLVVVSKVLLWVQDRLPADMFIRVHRSHLVNRLHVQQVKGNGTKTVELTSGEFVPVSRRRQHMLCQLTD